MYLMGRADDTYNEGMYPIVKVMEIKKEDLLRCERDEIMIFNLEDNTYYNYKTNSWVKCKIYKTFVDQWNKNRGD